jgi:hypothetical protein
MALGPTGARGAVLMASTRPGAGAAPAPSAPLHMRKGNEIKALQVGIGCSVGLWEGSMEISYELDVFRYGQDP